MVSFLAVGVGLDLNPWELGLVSDWSFKLWGPKVAIGLGLDWFWIGSGQEFALKSSSNFLFARGKKQKGFFMRVLGQISPFVPRAKKDLDEGFRANFVRHYIETQLV